MHVHPRKGQPYVGVDHHRANPMPIDAPAGEEPLAACPSQVQGGWRLPYFGGGRLAAAGRPNGSCGGGERR
uniref:Uncharacterized protein n=1 Tax=Arundo donax TaxID=35708 RepID=A0A0A9F551_ARUDO